MSQLLRHEPRNRTAFGARLTSTAARRSRSRAARGRCLSRDVGRAARHAHGRRPGYEVAGCTGVPVTSAPSDDIAPAATSAARALELHLAGRWPAYLPVATWVEYKYKYTHQSSYNGARRGGERTRGGPTVGQVMLRPIGGIVPMMRRARTTKQRGGEDAGGADGEQYHAGHCEYTAKASVT